MFLRWSKTGLDPKCSLMKVLSQRSKLSMNLEKPFSEQEDEEMEVIRKEMLAIFYCLEDCIYLDLALFLTM